MRDIVFCEGGIGIYCPHDTWKEPVLHRWKKSKDGLIYAICRKYRKKYIHTRSLNKS